MNDAITAGVWLPLGSILPGLEDRHLDLLNRAAAGIVWRAVQRRQEFLDLLPDCDIAVVYHFRHEWLEAATRLRLISTPAAGREMVQARSGPGLEVRYGTFHGELMAETVLAMLLAFYRGVKPSLDRQKTQPWARLEIASGMRQLRGTHAVIVGFGHIGKWVGRALSAMGVRITGVVRNDRSIPEYFVPGDRVITVDELDSELPAADHLILTLPGDRSTTHLIDSRRLGLLQPSAYIYNVGRGNAVDTHALAHALQEGRIAGAGLDVFEQEPLPVNSPLRRCPNVILMPHVSAFAPTYIDLYIQELLRQVKELFPSHIPDGEQ